MSAVIGPGPAGVGRRFRGPGSVRPDTWSDPMVAVAAIHATLLIGLDSVARPGAVAVITILLVTWHLVIHVVFSAEYSRLVQDAGSQVAAAVVVVLDGGTESPFFFWVLLFLASHTLRHEARRFLYLAVLALSCYLMVLALTEVTVAGVGRFGLLVAYCAVAWYLRRALDREMAEARRVDTIMRTAFDGAPVGIVLLNDSLDRVYANGPAQRLIDQVEASEGEARLRTSTGEVIELADALAMGMKQALPGPNLIRVELAREHLDVRVFSVPVEVDGDRLMLVFTEDVTQIVASGEERAKFIQAAAHQFRTPLTPIMGYASMLEAGELDPAATADAAQAIHDGAKRLEELLDRLSMLLHLRSSVPGPQRAVTIGVIITSARGSQRGVELFGDPSIKVQCDPEAAALGLSELIHNGAVHGVHPVSVRWVHGPRRVEVRVSDAGPGPPLEHGAALESIWSSASGGDVVSTQMGAQLGLSQARTLLALAGGDLTFERAPDRWSFVVGFVPALVPEPS